MKFVKKQNMYIPVDIIFLSTIKKSEFFPYDTNTYKLSMNLIT
jgi:hypothetical protein